LQTVNRASSTQRAAPPDISDVIRSHRAFISRILLRAGVARRDLPDAEQEVFLVVQRRLVEFEGRARITTWLCRIALYVASDYRRRAYNRREALDDRSHETRAGSLDACQVLEQQETFRSLLAALDRLTDDKRDTFLLYELEELSMAEIAKRADIPLKTAFSRLYAARRELRAWLQKDGVILGIAPLLWPRRSWQLWIEAARWQARAPLLASTAAAALCGLLALVQSDRLRPPPLQSASPPPIAASAWPAPAATTLPDGAAPPELPTARPAPMRTVPNRRLDKSNARAIAPRELTPTPLAAQSAELELQVYRSGALDVLAPRVLPFGFDEVTPRRPAGIQLRGPLDAVEGVEQALR